jgi:hypothetical protein
MKFNIDLGEIITKSWKITWKFKVLWIFGILSGCVSSNQGNFNFNGGNSGGSGGNNGTGDGNEQLPDFLRQFQNMNPEQAVREFLGQYMAIIVGVILLLCVLWFLFYFLGLMGKVGLIKGAGKADAGAESMSFGELWTESLPYFWRMFGLSLIIGLPSFILVVVLLVGLGLGAYTAITGDVSQGGMIAVFAGLVGAFVLLVCCFSLVMLVVGLIVEQSYNAIVLEDRGLLESLGRGWEVFRKNVLSVIVVGLVQWVMGLVISIAEAIVGLIIAIPFILVVIFAVANNAQLATEAGKGTIAALILTICCMAALLVPFSLLVSGIQNTYFQSMWTLTYRRLTDLAKPVLPAQVEIIEPQ